MENLYRVVIASRVPKSGCNTCSYFLPDDWELFTGPLRVYDASWTHCSECGDCCVRIYVPENDSFELERVNEDYIHPSPIVNKQTEMNAQMTDLMKLLIGENAKGKFKNLTD